MVVSGTAADLTRHVHIRQEVHLHLGNSITAAGFTTAALHIEAKPTLLISAHLSLRHLCKQIPNRIEHARIRRRIGARCTSDWGLIDVDDLIEVPDTANFLVRTGLNLNFIRNTRNSLVKDFIYKRGFAGAGHAGNAH